VIVDDTSVVLPLVYTAPPILFDDVQPDMVEEVRVRLPREFTAPPLSAEQPVMVEALMATSPWERIAPPPLPATAPFCRPRLSRLSVEVSVTLKIRSADCASMTVFSALPPFVVLARIVRLFPEIVMLCSK